MQIIVWPQTAVIAKNTDVGKKCDPYIKVSVGTNHKKTKVIEKGGQNPSWGDQFLFTGKVSDTISFKIYDEDTVFDDFIGEVKIPVLQVLATGGNLRQTFPFMSKYNNGVLTVQITIPNAASFAPPAAGATATIASDPAGIQLNGVSHTTMLISPIASASSIKTPFGRPPTVAVGAPLDLIEIPNFVQPVASGVPVAFAPVGNGLTAVNSEAPQYNFGQMPKQVSDTFPQKNRSGCCY